jgi:hypothetical protein
MSQVPSEDEVILEGHMEVADEPIQLVLVGHTHPVHLSYAEDPLGHAIALYVFQEAPILP